VKNLLKKGIAGVPVLALWLVLIVLVCVTFAPHWAHKDWRLDYLAHIKLHLTLVLIFLCPLLALVRRWRAFGLALVLLLVNGTQALQLPSWHSAPEGTRTYRIAFLNIFANNQEHAKVLRWIEEKDPNFVVFAEYSKRHAKVLDPVLQKTYPHTYLGWKYSGFGTAIYSKIPLNIPERRHGGEPSLIATVDLPEGLLTIMGVHPLSPQSESAFNTRNRQYESIARTAAAIDTPLVAVGDFNSTPWSRYFRELLKESGLKPVQTKLFRRATWHSELGYLGIPIDHALTKGAVVPIELSRGPDVGSDHFPILLDFYLPELRKGGE